MPSADYTFCKRLKSQFNSCLQEDILSVSNDPDFGCDTPQGTSLLTAQDGLQGQGLEISLPKNPADGTLRQDLY